MKMIRPKYTKSYVNELVFGLILVLSLILLTSIYLIRFYQDNNKSLFGEDTYFNLRISNLIQENNYGGNDTLSYGGRPYSYLLGWPLTLVYTSNISTLSLNFVSVLLPILFGILTLLLIGLTIPKFIKNYRLRNLTLLIIALSPTFLYFFSTSNAFAATIFLTALAFYLFTFNKPTLDILSVISLSLISFFSLFTTLFATLLFLIYVIKYKTKIKWFLLFLILTIIFEFNNYYKIVSNYGLPEIIHFDIVRSTLNFNYQVLFSDLGGKFGLSIFSVALLWFGVYVLWADKKYKYFLVYISVIILGIISIYLSFALFYLTVIISIIGSIGLLKLIEREWASKLIKNISLFILIAGIVFSGISSIYQIALSEPNRQQYQALTYIASKSLKDETIFSYYDRGFWFTYINRTNTLDPNFFYAPNINERWQDAINILESSKIENTIKILDKYGIDYIWIDGPVRERFFGFSNLNLEYQLNNDQRFKLFYRNYDINHNVVVEIWKYRKNV